MLLKNSLNLLNIVGSVVVIQITSFLKKFFHTWALIKYRWLINLYLKMNIDFMGLTDFTKLHSNFRTRRFLIIPFSRFRIYRGDRDSAAPAIIVTVKM